MDVLVLILFILIISFFIGNIILNRVLKFEKKILPFNSTDAKLDVLKSKIEILNNRISRIESKK
ncbi:MAG: hypothetical protein PHR26_00045 [Candidatus ainarchaeum sp.]|nr:hypothetical protein [Candidatus ainarchaeum sp.]MDD3976086.1 hypothetical protein [Candidatus ainarchaeum sp.]